MWMCGCVDGSIGLMQDDRNEVRNRAPNLGREVEYGGDGNGDGDASEMLHCIALQGRQVMCK